ncbi:Putative multidrug export ATP-binding/permease protein [Pseudoalteromonas holothuriae]|uniref:Multidrug export ATP-binding/permease protein n=1 Tax=Pseudoalteromonas holothuriae TaxID=2963714 RepID=A0A9W4R3K6_9GAMM|nr:MULTISPECIES: ABC transporter ATP-binding protein [unclassified Pseudoalteromonas]CAH9064655.1 Putative multidrug export ATP-binding/permease protein [Pseudoalteromonas sp. CIP111854]CAH9065657.1 Putative multidrug export ATP-binding/permease protein [Pseudoalteromonas sp. CIP111951]
MTQTLTWQGIKQQVLAHKKPLVVAHIIAFFAALVSVPIPLMMPLLVDEVLLAQPGPAIGFLNSLIPVEWQQSAVYIVIILLSVMCMRLAALVLGVIQSRQFTIIGKGISLSIRERLLTHLPRVQLKEYETQGAAAISSRCITDVETLDQFISQTLSRFLIGLLTILGTAIVLLWIDLTLGLVILLLNPAVIYFSRQFGKRVKDLKKEENAAFEAFQSALVETLDAISQLKAVRRETTYFDYVRTTAVDLKHRAVQSQWKTDAVNRLSFTIFLLGFEVFRAIAMLMVVFADLTVGQIFAVFGYLWFMMGPVQELLSIQYAYYGASAALQRLNQVFTFETETPAPKSVSSVFEQSEVGISFKRVSFAYQPELPVLQDVSLDIPAGKKVAVVAVSGGGKSTLVQLLLGLYEKETGNIEIANTPVEQIGYQTIRENVATVLQQPILFNSTIRDNLSLGHNHSDEQLWHALRVAELESTVKSIDGELSALVGRNGIRLSGGQKQRLAIARMVLANPKVVILDEATSALDIETEAKIHNNLKVFLRNRTTLIIAHRLSAIKQADLIYVLDDGRISQAGDHNSLLAEQGLYQTLFGHR